MTLFLGYFVIHEMGHALFYPYTKFEVSSFTRFKYREGVPKFKILALQTPMTPLCMYFVIHEMGYALFYLYTKFEVSSYNCSKFREGVQNSKFAHPDFHDPNLGDIWSSVS